MLRFYDASMFRAQRERRLVIFRSFYRKYIVERYFTRFSFGFNVHCRKSDAL